MPPDDLVRRSPQLTRSDAWLLAALTEGSHHGRSVSLRQLVHDADWLNRSIPSFDEVSFSLPRLIAAGFMTVESGRFRATPKATALRKSVKARTLGEVIVGMGSALGARPWPEPEPEDRSLGRLAGLEPEDLEAAVREHGAWVERRARPFVALAQALTKRGRRRS